MDGGAKLTAYDIVNGYPEQDLTEIIRNYGEERWAARIAEFIVKKREKSPIRTTCGLVDTILAAIPKGARRDGPHPARRTFMALRIFINDELGAIADTVKKSAALLKPGGRLCVIGFHSLEDRIVKRTFNELSARCICPKDLPVCVCGHKAVLKKITRKPVVPGENEIKRNPRSKSAKLRAAEKI
jgi:16S rRNA (cytosine1402-N4)-methyltransferase